MKNSANLLYSCGGFAASLSLSVFSTYVTFFYIDVLKMPSAVIGIAMVIYGLWNAVSQPIIGQISDRTRTKRGRRIPYILYCMLPFALFFTLIWIPPVKWMHGSIAEMFTYFILITFAFDILATFVFLNWTALFPEMFKTQKQRTKVSAFKQIFGMLGGILAVALPPVIYPIIGWGAMGISFGVLTLVFLALSLMGAKEDPACSHNEGISLVKSMKVALTNKSFLTYVMTDFFVVFTYTLIAAVLPFYAKYVLRIQGVQNSLLMGGAFITALLCVVIWGRIANKIGSKKTIVISLVLYGMALIPYWFSTSFPGAFIGSLLVGIGMAGANVNLVVLLSDVIDEDELKTGVRREGVYFGINGFMERIVVCAEALILSGVLAMSGYNANLSAAQQPQSALVGIRVILVLIPLAAITGAFLFIRKYSLTGDRLREVKRKLEPLDSTFSEEGQLFSEEGDE